MSTLNVDLPAEIFDTQVNIPLIHQVVVAQQAAARQGSADTKSRGEVRGGGRKPYRQKGTGRARQGSTRAPQFAGGGVVHGPTPRKYDQRTPKKMKVAALRGALSDRARAGRIHVVDGFTSGDTPSTKQALAGLAALTVRPRTLVVMQREDAVTWLSLRNVDSVHLLAVDQLNTYDVLLADDVVFTKGAFDAFVTGAGTRGIDTGAGTRGIDTGAGTRGIDTGAGAPSGKSVKAVATSSEVSDIADVTDLTEGPYGAGSAEPLEDGAAPEGFTVKGNKDSMKYHRPEGRWYDATTAEVWFRTAEDAEAAGFVEAGSKAKTKAEDDK